MTTARPRRLRADAVRNTERLVRAAREVYAEQGSEAGLEEIARRAGVGIATVYRRFPDKAGLVRAAFDQGFTDDVLPVVERALTDADPYRGLVTVLEAALSLGVSHRNVLAAARDVGVLTTETTAPFVDALTLVAARARDAGVIRDDLVREDIARIVVMLVGVLATIEPGSDGWRRYLDLVLDALAPTAAHPLPPVTPLPARYGSADGSTVTAPSTDPGIGSTL